METVSTYPCPHCGYDPGAESAFPYALQPGTILNGKYVVGTVLGQGGFGITYSGWDLALESKVAIKEYFPSAQVSRTQTSGALQWYNTEAGRTARDSGREMFLKEARKMARVSRIPQVVRVLDLFQQNNTAYIVMDFVEGENLKNRLKKTGPLPWDQARDIFLPAIDAMERVHKAGLVHRDLSPDNLMLTPDGSVRILDLGAAKDLNINTGASSMQVAKGGFSPLEQYIQSGGSGPWTDVYAMAATMYFTFTGVLPLPSVDRLAKDTLRWDLPQLAALPGNVLTALQKAMVISPEARTQSMAEFAAQLTQVSQDPFQKEYTESDSLSEESLSQDTEPLGNYPENDSNLMEKLSRLDNSQDKTCKDSDENTDGLSQSGDQDVPNRERGFKIRPIIILALVVVIIAVVSFFTIHIWTPATCTEPAKCKICGKTTGSPLGHKWPEPSHSKLLHCSVCGAANGVITLLPNSDVSSLFSDDEVQFTLKNGKKVGCSVIRLNHTIENCTSVTVKLEISKWNYGNIHGEWGFYIRDLGGKWSQAGTFVLSGNSASATFTFEDPVSFDAWACPCHSLGSSWSFSFNVWLEKAWVFKYTA